MRRRDPKREEKIEKRQNENGNEGEEGLKRKGEGEERMYREEREGKMSPTYTRGVNRSSPL